MRIMNRLVFFLSGEHPSIPSSEVIGGIEAEGFCYEFDEELDQVLSLKTDADPAKLSRRLGMCHWIGEHFCICRVEDLFESIGSSDLFDFLKLSESIGVRTKRVKRYLPEVDTQELAKKIADKLLVRFDYDVDLDYPDNEIVCILTEGKCVLTVIQAKVEREAFEERKPQERVAVHPSTMQPNIARALVNLARTPRGGRFLDPFCGVGGILIEAGLIGADLIGIDINSELVDGAERNLRQAGLKEFDIREGDVRDLDIRKVDAIATDPPYGRQASTGGSELEELYQDTMPVISDVLKSDGYLCITAPDRLDLKGMVEDIPLTMVERHGQRVHGSLTRNIYVFRRD